MSLILPILMVISGTVADAPAARQVLAKLEQARSGLISGTVEWSVEHRGLKGELAESRFTSRYARNGDMIFEERGDAHGVTARDRQGRPTSHTPRHCMLNHNGFWIQQGLGAVAKVWSGVKKPPHPYNDFIKDIRFAGVTSTDGSLKIGEAPARLYVISPDGARLTPKLEWSVQAHDGLQTVTARSVRDGSRCVWDIDPKRGWNAVHIATYSALDEKPAASATVSLKKFGEVWFPEAVQYHWAGKQSTVIHVRRAKFNAPDDPKSFSATDLGIEVGANVNYDSSAPPPGDLPIHGFWTGEKSIAYPEYRKLVKEGKLKVGPTIAAITRGEDPDTPYMTPEERNVYLAQRRQSQYEIYKASATGGWAYYLKDVHSKVNLTEEQIASARAILTECGELADRYCEEHKAEFIRYFSERPAALKVNDRKALQRLEGVKRALDLPLGKIRTEQVEPRIQSLLTTEQRAKLKGG